MASSSRPGASAGTVQASATVLDFICLFTHDLKRKQKRWQDGALKYHTFNKRIMVYDDRGHFIGDAHWQGETPLDTGDEFELDRGAAIVQVSDCTGQREQDLTELLDKRAREVEKRRANAVSRTPRPSARPAVTVERASAQDQNLHFQLRQRPLADMLGTPARIGRAVISPHSPYEVRQMAQKSEQNEDTPTAKRRKQEVSPPSKSSHARALFGATLSLTPLSQNSRPAPTSIRHNWATTELKSLLSSNEPPKPPQSSSEEQLEPEAVQSDEVMEVASSPPAPRPVTRRSPKPSSRATGNANKLTAVSVQSPGLPQPAKVDLDKQPRNQPTKQATARNEPSPQLARRAAAQATASSRPEATHDVIVLEDDEPTNSKTLSVKSSKKANKVQKMAFKEVPEETEVVVEREATKLPSRLGDAPQPRGEPRTELRIRSRQRRGLLLMSERGNGGKRPNKTQIANAAEVQREPGSGPLKEGDHASTAGDPCLKPHPSLAPIASITEEKEDEANIRALTVVSEVEVTAPNCNVNDATEEDMQDGSLVSKQDSPPAREPTLCEKKDSSEADEPPRKTRTSKRLVERGSRSRKRLISDSSSEEETEAIEPHEIPQGVPKAQAVRTGSNAPRFAKMRRSVKSKEIIGFVVPNDEPIFKLPPFAHPPAATGSIGQACSGDTNVDEAESVSHKQNVQQLPAQSKEVTSVAQSGLRCSPDDSSLTKPTPRLCNPATRGKKAARKEDAAGQVPQKIIHLEPIAPTRIGAPKPAPHLRRESTMPGFTKANGGAWSVHAEDLLGMTRPVDKPSRQR